MREDMNRAVVSFPAFGCESGEAYAAAKKRAARKRLASI